MAAKTKRKTEDDDLQSDGSPVVADDFATPVFADDAPTKEETGLDDDSGFYTMGDIKVDEAEDSSDEEFKKASKSIKSTAEDESDDEEWVDDDSVNWSDTDDFLDEENVDFENYEYEKDNY